MSRVHKSLVLASPVLLTMGARSVTAAVSEAEFEALKAQVAELQKKEGENWLTAERTAEIKAIVSEAIAEAKRREQTPAPNAGFQNGFYIQSPDRNFKLVLGLGLQARYEYAYFNATSGRTLPGRPVGAGSTTPSDPGNASGFDVRRARVTFSGNAFSPDLTYRLEGDFYNGGNGGAFTVTDAYIAYRFTDMFRVRAGSYKVPFAKSEVLYDFYTEFAEKLEVMAPFDPVRALGASVYGDFIKDTLTYEVNINDGSRTNTLKQPDVVGGSANLGHRPAIYGRVQWAGSGSVQDFAEEADLRQGERPLVWLLGGAVGWESENASNNAFPAPQTTTVVSGLSNGQGPGFTNYTLNGDLYRATLDWSAKWAGWSVNTAAYFQQVNANPGNTSTASPNVVSVGPYGRSDASFFQQGYYFQVGYFIVPQRLELMGRASYLLTEGYPNIGEFYSVGAAYYFMGNNAKIQGDVTYTPEAPFTDATPMLLQNLNEVIFRFQVQLKF